eukprot:jgi/Ulvmu1/6277/UM028_0137.1
MAVACAGRVVAEVADCRIAVCYDTMARNVRRMIRSMSSAVHSAALCRTSGSGAWGGACGEADDSARRGDGGEADDNARRGDGGLASGGRGEKSDVKIVDCQMDVTGLLVARRLQVLGCGMSALRAAG